MVANVSIPRLIGFIAELADFLVLQGMFAREGIVRFLVPKVSTSAGILVSTGKQIDSIVVLVESNVLQAKSAIMVHAMCPAKQA